MSEAEPPEPRPPSGLPVSSPDPTLDDLKGFAARLRRAAPAERRTLSVKRYAEIEGTRGRGAADHEFLLLTLLLDREEKKEPPWWVNWILGILAAVLVAIATFVIPRILGDDRLELRVTKVEVMPLSTRAAAGSEILVAEQMDLDVLVDGQIIRAYDRVKRGEITADKPIEFPSAEGQDLAFVLVRYLKTGPPPRLRYEGLPVRLQARGGGSILLSLTTPGAVPDLDTGREYWARVHYTLFEKASD